MKRIILYSVFQLACLICFSQYNVDSLESRLSQSTGAEKAKTHNELFKIYINSSPALAIEHAYKAMETATEVGDSKGLAASLNNLGVAYKNQGVYDKALDFYLQSLRLSTSIDDQFMVASTLNNIGTVYSLKGINDKALIYFIESYESFAAQKRERQMIGALNNIGNAYFDNRREDKALEYYEKAIALSEVAGDSNNMFDPINNMGNIHFELKNYNKALEMYQKANAIAQSSNNKYEQALSLSNIGVTLFHLNSLSEAEKELHSGLSLAEDINSTLLLQNIYGSLSELYYAKKQYKEAFDALVTHDQYEDQLHNEEGSRKIAQMEAALAFEEKDKELEVLRKQSEIDRLVVSNSRIVIMISIMGAILLIAIGFIVYILKKEANVTFYRKF